MAKSTEASFDYAAKTAELETVLAQLQSDDISLDEAIKLHDVGKKLVAELEEYLKTAEVTVRRRVAGE